MLKGEDIVQLTSVDVQFPLLAAEEGADFAEGFSEGEEAEEISLSPVGTRIAMSCRLRCILRKT